MATQALGCLVSTSSRGKLVEIEHPKAGVATKEKNLIMEAQRLPTRDLSGREQTNNFNIVTLRQARSGSGIRK